MEAAGGLDPPPIPTNLDIMHPPPPLPSDMIIQAVTTAPIPPPPVDQPPQLNGPPLNASDEQEPHVGSDDGSGSDHDDSEDEEDQSYHHRWQHIEEDRSVPCEDELKYIESKEEYSALDHAHWERITFFDLDDPELVPIDSGRIDWLIGAFNGTEENPNNEQVMKSAVVHIGGLDWQIKFYPRGQDSDFLSCFVECVSMRSPDFAECEKFEYLPFPCLKGTDTIMKRRSVAVQLGVLMYNPSEPRVYEYKFEATQFNKATADFGWKYFSQRNRYEFHYRQHTQRQAILRDDKLAFSAYIRVIHDPTGCMWRQTSRNNPDEITATTGLRPFTKSLQHIAGAVPLLHFAPFRSFVQNLRPESQLGKWLQPLLLKMYTRKRSANYGSQGTHRDGDVVELLWRMANSVQNEYGDGTERALFNELVGAFHSERGSACGANRLNTKEHASVQAAVHHHTKLISRPALLTLEFQRQEHDKKDRKWKKLTNKVTVEEHISVSGTPYTLFAFVTHCGHLQSSRYNSYIRPKGIGKGWYAYQDGRVTCLTEKQARERHSGQDSDTDRQRSPENGHDSPFSEHYEEMAEVTSVVMYVRDDVASSTFDAPDEEVWVPVLSAQKVPDHPLKAAPDEHLESSNGDCNAQHRHQLVGGDEHVLRLASMRETIDQAATQSTPEPVTMDGEDVVMKDADDESSYSIEAVETNPIPDEDLEVGTVDWLGRAYYEGRWKDGKYHGGGHLIAANGDEYLGHFNSGAKHGYGKMIYAVTGDLYEGEWSEDFPHGRGKLIEHSTGNVYEGSFKQGRKHGDFVLKGTVTEEDKSCCSICYEKEMSTAFYDCGHVVACRDCAAQIDTCPVCRRRVVARLQLFGVRISQS